MKIIGCNHPEPHLCFRNSANIHFPSKVIICITTYYKNCKYSEPKEITLTCLWTKGNCEDKAKGVCNREHINCISQGYLIENETDLHKRLINALSKNVEILSRKI